MSGTNENLLNKTKINMNQGNKDIITKYSNLYINNKKSFNNTLKTMINFNKINSEIIIKINEIINNINSLNSLNSLKNNDSYINTISGIYKSINKLWNGRQKIEIYTNINNKYNEEKTQLDKTIIEFKKIKAIINDNNSKESPEEFTTIINNFKHLKIKSNQIYISETDKFNTNNNLDDLFKTARNTLRNSVLNHFNKLISNKSTSFNSIKINFDKNKDKEIIEKLHNMKIYLRDIKKDIDRLTTLLSEQFSLNYPVNKNTNTKLNTSLNNININYTKLNETLTTYITKFKTVTAEDVNNLSLKINELRKTLLNEYLKFRSKHNIDNFKLIDDKIEKLKNVINFETYKTAVTNIINKLDTTSNPNQTKPNQSKPNQANSNQTKPTQSKTNQNPIKNQSLNSKVISKAPFFNAKKASTSFFGQKKI